jgi:heat shock protein HslJ
MNVESAVRESLEALAAGLDHPPRRGLEVVIRSGRRRRNLRRLGGVALGLALVYGLMSVPGDPSPPVVVDDVVEGIAGNWRLVSGIDLPPDTPVTVSITRDGSRGGISWSGPCNSFGSELRFDGSSLEVRGISGTAAGCPEPYGTADGTVELAIGGISQFEMESDRLRLIGASVLEFERIVGSIMSDLFGQTWSLVSMEHEGVVQQLDGDTPTLEFFPNGEVTVGTACGRTFGLWSESAAAWFVNSGLRAEEWCAEPSQSTLEQSNLIDRTVRDPGAVDLSDDGTLTITKRGTVLEYRAGEPAIARRGIPDVDGLSIAYGCFDFAFGLGNQDDTVVLRLRYVGTDQSEDTNQREEPVTLPDPDWEVYLVVGQNLHAGWCEAVIPEGSSGPVEENHLEVTGGQITWAETPSDRPAADSLTFGIVGMEVTALNGEAVPVGDVLLTDQNRGSPD